MSTQWNVIGETAGKIYQSLEQNGKREAAKLQKEVGADAALFNQALGWLAREGNIQFDKQGKTWQLSLVKSDACCA